MKGLAFLLIVALTIYFVWVYASKRDKRTVINFTQRHAAAVLAIIVALYLLTVAAINFRALNII